MLYVKSRNLLLLHVLGLKICGINLNKGYGPTSTLIPINTDDAHSHSNH